MEATKIENQYFYPRSPCGERPPMTLRHCTTYLFLSTLSLRRATAETAKASNADTISIHALLAESDARRDSRQQPAGISIHALLAESDLFFGRDASKSRISIHALLAESDVKFSVSGSVISDFYPRSPCGERHDTSSLMACQVKFLSTLSLRRATSRCGWLEIVC